MRKYHLPDFKQMVETIKIDKFTFLSRYKKAEAIIGESKSCWLVEAYFNNPKIKNMMVILDWSELTSEFIDNFASVELANMESEFEIKYNEIIKVYGNSDAQ